jgi:hypothetical protein
MNSKGIMRRARRRILVFVSTMLVVSVGFAQTPAARSDDDLDVTMRVIVDPDAKVPDEIVRRISLPKPQSSTDTAPKSDKPNEQGKPTEPGAKGKERSSEAREQGREFGQQTAEQAKQRADEARRNEKPPGPPNNPPGPPTPPGPPNPPPRGPG